MWPNYQSCRRWWIQTTTWLVTLNSVTLVLLIFPGCHAYTCCGCSDGFWPQLQRVLPLMFPSQSEAVPPPEYLAESLCLLGLRLQFSPPHLLSIISRSKQWAYSAKRTQIECVLGQSQGTQSFKSWQQCRGEPINAGEVCWQPAVNSRIRRWDKNKICPPH